MQTMSLEEVLLDWNEKELIWCYRDHHQHHSEKNVEFNQEEFAKVSVSESTTSSNESHFTDLNCYELERLQEVHEAMTIFPDETKLECIGETDSILDAFNLPAGYVTKYIKFCKDIEAFRSFSSNDQLVIMKKFYAEISAIRFSFTFDIEKDGGYLALEGTDKVKFVNFNIFEIYNRQDLGNLFRNFCISLKIEMEDDEKLRNLIIAYFIFNKRENISCQQEYVSYNQALYAHLIRRYLEMKYKNLMRADTKYNSLMQVLGQMDHICKTIEEVYLSFDSEQLAQILTEIYNKH